MTTKNSRPTKRVRAYRQGLGRIEVLTGEEVFKGTRVSVRHIGNLLRKGVTLEEIKEDYPSLTSMDIHFARIYAAIKRPPGPPSKPGV